MKNILTAIIFSLGFVQVQASIKPDTTVIEFTDKGTKKRLSVQSDSKNFMFKIPSNLNLDNLLSEIGVDSSNRKKTIIMVENGSKKDTIVAITRDGHSIKIVTKDPRPESMKKDTLGHEPRRRYDNETDNDVNQGNKPQMNDTYQDNNGNNGNNGTNERPKKQADTKYFARKDFGLYLGLNGLMAESGVVPDLETWGSRYVALSWRKNKTLVKTKQLDVALSIGPEIAWNNFRFKNNQFLRNDKTNNQVSFEKAAENLRKSKLVVPTVNLPIMLNFGFKQSNINIGFGGYVGYRVGGYTRIDTNEERKIKTRDAFGMSSWRKGLTAEVGKKNGITFFVRKDVDNLFTTSQSKINNQLQGWSAGVRL